MRKIALATLLLVAIPFAASGTDVTASSDALKWGPQPPSLPAGAQLAVVSGDPGKSEPYVLRAKLPAGYMIPPHTHPTDENVTVISGTFHFAMGDKLDKTKGDVINASGFFRAEASMPHYGWSSEPTEIQVHGIGPFEITYVNPSDDPRNASTTGMAPATTSGTSPQK